ncbi:MAG TPA: histidine phosphatase family protein [Xanthobacteraceae bacterium]|jgi:phosphohistidine phosphatase|nr:histidine phosphatase family protein [Xanthobacteraceae bacterium]
MRRLLLLRHAKAETAKPGRRDHDRILAERGRSDAEGLGVYLTRHTLVPDQALVSDAARTRETWARLAQAFKPPFDEAEGVRFEDSLYEASPETILHAIRQTERKVRTLLVVGHNPGLQQLAAVLIASGDVDARRRLQESFPTSALAVIHFATNDWSELHPSGGRLEHFITPRWLKEAAD